MYHLSVPNIHTSKFAQFYQVRYTVTRLDIVEKLLKSNRRRLKGPVLTLTLTWRMRSRFLLTRVGLEVSLSRLQLYIWPPLPGGHVSNNRNFAPLFFLRTHLLSHHCVSIATGIRLILRKQKSVEVFFCTCVQICIHVDVQGLPGWNGDDTVSGF